MQVKVKIMKTMLLVLQILDISIPQKGELEPAPGFLEKARAETDPNFFAVAPQPCDK